MRAGDYDRFSVVAFAAGPLGARIEELRTALPPSGRPILAPHVTLYGPFVEPADLGAIGERIRRCCTPARGATVETADLYHYTYGSFASVGLGVDVPRELADLHACLMEALRDLCAPLGAPGDQQAYHPHLTIVQQIDAEVVPEVRARIERFGVAGRLDLRAASLVGRRVNAAWETLLTAPFAG